MQKMHFKRIYHASYHDNYYLHWRRNQVEVHRKKGQCQGNRRILALLFAELLEGTKDREISSAKLRQIWREEAKLAPPWDLPTVIGHDAFLTMYAEGLPLKMGLFRRIYERAQDLEGEPESDLGPLIIGATPNYEEYYDVKSVPPGLSPKLSSGSRKRHDPKLLSYVQSDLSLISEIEEKEKRNLLTLAVLSHGAAYRELDGDLLHIPSLTEQEKGILVPYALRVHLLWEGVKTVSLTPLEKEHEEPGIYLCQGTEIWPSQPLMLGSIIANLSVQGSATEPYAHAWRQIHRHLRALAQKGAGLPIVSGHSMGGALATQIALYSHPLIKKAYAFNPPVVEERDEQVYRRLPERAKNKLQVYASIDDFPFWRIGSCAVGRVHLFLGEKRWKYHPFSMIDRLLIVPVLIKAFINFLHLVPSHQDIVALMPSYCMVPLTSIEMAQENAERTWREDKIRFFPKTYRFVKFLLNFTRKHFRWEKRREYLLSQIEIIELHIKDVKETLAMAGSEDVNRELEELYRQKEEIERRISLEEGEK